MGNKAVRTKESIMVDRLILESFKDTDLEIPITEINKLKNHFKDAEKYFNFKFDYLIYFNNKLFHEGLPVLYDNYISKVEQFSSKFKSSKKIFSIFIDFEQEYELEEEMDLEFDPIFTVIFEKLEIKNILCFYLVNSDIDYLQMFFEQLYENVYLYKDSRNYDSLYFLLPNTDYFIKNEDYLLYICNGGNKVDKSKEVYINNFETNYNEIIFNTNYFNKFLNLKSSPNYCSSKINTFLENIPDSLFFKYISEIDLDDKDKLNFINQQKRFFDFHKLLCSKAPYIQIIFLIKNELNNDNIHNLTNLIKFIITNCQNSPQQNCLQVIKIIKIENSNDNNNNIGGIGGIASEEKNSIENSQKEETRLSHLDKFIQMILNLSFIREIKRHRKIIIEYYNIYKIIVPNTHIKNTQKKLENLAKNQNEIFINNLDEEGVEDSDIKEKTIYHFNNELISYEWFLKDNSVKNIKMNIIYILDYYLNKFNTEIINKSNKNKKNNNNTIVNTKEKIGKIKKIIFSYIFPDKTNKYYYSQYIYQNSIKNNESNFQKQIFI